MPFSFIPLPKIAPSLAVLATAAALAIPQTAKAGTDPYLGEIMQVGFNFCPRGWANADGQILPISQYTALFSLYGTTFGGDGRTTFALPDLRSRSSVHYGSGPGLPPTTWGERYGVADIPVNVNTLANHTHTITTSHDLRMYATESSADSTAPNDEALLADSGTTQIYHEDASVAVTALAPSSVGGSVQATAQATGGNQSPTNYQPSLGILHCVALEGSYPPRN